MSNAPFQRLCGGSFVKRRERRCKKCFSKRYGSKTKKVKLNRFLTPTAERPGWRQFGFFSCGSIEVHSEYRQATMNLVQLIRNEFLYEVDSTQQITIAEPSRLSSKTASIEFVLVPMSSADKWQTDRRVEARD